MKRETITKEQIRNLNLLSWDRRYYANYHFADGTVGLEINYYLGDIGYFYKVICEDEGDMHKLRNELDENTKLVELYDGRMVSCSK